MSATRGRTEASVCRWTSNGCGKTSWTSTEAGGLGALLVIPASSCWPASLLCFDAGRDRGLEMRSLGQLALRGHLVTHGPPNCRLISLDRFGLVRRPATQWCKDRDAPEPMPVPGRCLRHVQDSLHGRPWRDRVPQGGSRFRRPPRRSQQNAPSLAVCHPPRCLPQRPPATMHRLPQEGTVHGSQPDRLCR